MRRPVADPVNRTGAPARLKDVPDPRPRPFVRALPPRVVVPGALLALLLVLLVLLAASVG